MDLLHARRATQRSHAAIIGRAESALLARANGVENPAWKRGSDRLAVTRCALNAATSIPDETVQHFRCFVKPTIDAYLNPYRRSEGRELLLQRLLAAAVEPDRSDCVCPSPERLLATPGAYFV